MPVWLSIQYLRGCAALAVVWLHSHVELELISDRVLPTQHYGDFGVDLFFVISGFIIWITTDNDRSRPIGFWCRRALRVIPLYWLCTLAMVVLLIGAPRLFDGHHLDVGHIVQSLLFIPHYDPFEPDKIYPLLTVGWTLNFEMFFYASFGVALLLRQNWRLAAMAIWLGLLVAAGAVFSPEQALFATYTDPLLLEFLAGMLIGYASKRLQQPPLIVGYGLVSLAVVVFVALDQGLDVVPIDWRVLCWGLPAALLIAGVVVIEQQARIPHVAGLHLLGDASFAIYLSHPFTLGALGWAWSRLTLETALPSLAFVVVAMLLSALGGILLHLVFEKALVGGIRNWTRSRQPLQVAFHGQSPGG